MEIFYFIITLSSLFFLCIVSFVDKINVYEAMRNIIFAFLGLNILEKLFTDSSLLIENGRVKDIYKRKLIVFIFIFIYSVLVYIFMRENFDLFNFYIIICGILLVKGGDYYVSSVDLLKKNNKECSCGEEEKE